MSDTPCPKCGALVPADMYDRHMDWHAEVDPVAFDSDLEAERVTHTGETHKQLMKRIRKERIEPSWKGKP